MQPAKPPIRVLILIAVLLAGLLSLVLYVQHRMTPKNRVATPQTRPAESQPTTQSGPKLPEFPRTYAELVLKENADYPTTQPVPPVEISSAGHLLIHDPVYLDLGGNLWITVPEAEADDVVLKKAGKQQVNLIHQAVKFVFWQRDDAGNWVPTIIVPNDRDDGFDALAPKVRKSIGDGKGYDWGRAVPLARGRIAVPTELGMSIFDLNLEKLASNARIAEYPSPPLAKAGDGHARVEYAIYDGEPIIWIPPSGKHPGSAGAYRPVQEAWFRLSDEEQWPAGLVQLIPLNDAIVQLRAEGPDAVKLAMVSMQAGSPDEDKIIRLILSLSDPDPKKRTAAYQELTKYGPVLWPIAERMMETEGPETQARLKDLLRSKISPLLGGMEIVGSRLRLVSRYAHGGALFFCDRGVSIPRGDEVPRVVAPAWLSVVPGDSVRLVPPELTRELAADKHVLIPIDAGKWLVYDEVEGMRYALEGVGFLPLLRPDERKFDRFVGVDSAGRYLFRSGKDLATLILDPTMPDANRRLPVWQVTYAKVGWDNENYPAVQWGAQQVSFRVRDWSRIETEKGGRFFTDEKDVPTWPPLRIHPATRPVGTRPSTHGSFPEADQKPLLVDGKGDYYFGGKESLVVIRPDGSRQEWALPATATGSLQPWLVETKDHRLFLYNQPGRILKIRPTPQDAEPFRLEATFSRRVPNTEHVTRIWVDPLGRICMAYEEKWLAILFPQGYVPAETKDVIPGPDLDEMLRDE